MKILVTGAKGQLGSELKERGAGLTEHEFLFSDLPELDITDPVAVEHVFAYFKPQVLLNCAAYTAVDKAETEPEKAMLVNATAVGNLAVACQSRNVHLIHISTDYIFDGTNHKPYLETDLANPVSAYAKSKHGGELVLLNSGCNATIIRTSWLYSSYGHNFVKTILRIAREKGSLNVVTDQVGTPTYAGDLATMILSNLEKMISRIGCTVFNYSNEGVASWYDFALAATEIAGIPCTIHPIPTSKYPTPATRPFYSVLDKEKIRSEMGIRIPHWRESLSHCIHKINP